MREKPTLLQWVIEIIGILLSVFSVLFSIVTLYSFPLLILDFNYRVPPLVFIIMEYHQKAELGHLMSAKVGAFVFLVSLVTVTFILSKLLNNLLEKNLRDTLTKSRKAAEYSVVVKVLFQFALMLLLASGFLYLVIII